MISQLSRILICCAAVVALGSAGAAVRADAQSLESSVDSLVNAALSRDQSVSYAVGVKRGDDVVVARGYGMADLEDEIYANEQTIYRLGSITKQFTAAAIMQLVEQDKINLDDEITKFLPDYPTQGHRITIDHLLTHTSGIKSYTSLENFWTQAARDLTHDEMIEIFGNEPFDFAPGAKYEYNNSAFYLLGVIIEKIADQSYGDYLQQNIFGPLELSRTSYCHEHQIIRGRAQGYRKVDGEIQNDAPISMNTPGAAGALCSTVSDLMWWQDAFNDGRIVSRASREKMITSATLNDGSDTNYGYGLGLRDFEGQPTIAHGGGIFGFNTQMTYFPNEDLTIVVLANTEGSNPGRIVRDIARLALGIKPPDVVDLSLSTEQLAVYEGTYQVGSVSPRISVRDGSLHLDGPGLDVRLKAQGDHTFVFAEDHDNRIVFEVTRNRASSMTVFVDGNNLVGQRIN